MALSSTIMPKALVTGASGFVGSHLAEKLLQKNYEVYALVRQSSNLSWIESSNLKLIYGDITDKKSLDSLPYDLDYIFHCAGLIRAKRPPEFFQANFEGTKNLLEAAVRLNLKLKRFLHISSQAACGPRSHPRPKTEQEQCHPITPYGESKLLAEKEALKYIDKLPLTVVRPPAIYGPRDKATLPFFKAVKYRINPVLGDNESRFNIIYIKDLVEGIVKAAECKNSIGQIYFLTDGQIYSVSSALKIIARAMNVKLIKIKMTDGFVRVLGLASELIFLPFEKPVVFNRQKAKELLGSYWICDITKAKDELGYNPVYDLNQGSHETVSWYKENEWL